MPETPGGDVAATWPPTIGFICVAPQFPLLQQISLFLQIGELHNRGKCFCKWLMVLEASPPFKKKKFVSVVHVTLRNTVPAYLLTC